MRPPALAEVLAERLATLEAQGLTRRLQEARGLDLCSNDYLGLAADPGFRAAVMARLAALPAGGLTTPASRLLRGESEHHRRLEARFAAYKGQQAALFFASGYQANVGLLSTLVTAADRVLSDRLNHASLIDGLRLAGARRVIFPHLDLATVEEVLATPHPGGRTFVVTESLFSMDGDIAPLDRYAELCDRYGADLIVDDAHATGLFGTKRGSGLVEAFGVAPRVAATLSTCGKALAVSGAFVSGSRELIDLLLQRARSFVFSTAPPPLLLAAIEAALDVIAAEPARRARVRELARSLRGELRAWGLTVPGGEGPIVPVVLGSNERALAVAATLQEQGFDIRAIRPPTVPEGTARLRISVHADHREADLARLASLLGAVAGPQP